MKKAKFIITILIILSTKSAFAVTQNSQNTIEAINNKIYELNKLKMEEMELRRQLKEMLDATEQLSKKLDQHNKTLDNLANHRE